MEMYAMLLEVYSLPNHVCSKADSSAKLDKSALPCTTELPQDTHTGTLGRQGYSIQ